MKCYLVTLYLPNGKSLDWKFQADYVWHDSEKIEVYMTSLSENVLPTLNRDGVDYDQVAVLYIGQGNSALLQMLQ